MLDFLPYFQIIIGLYISFCFEKLIQSLLWSEEFTNGLTLFYHDWSTLAWYKKDGEEEQILKNRIEQSIKGYVSRTKKLGLFMLVSVSTMLLSYCWIGHHMERNDQFMLAYSFWNFVFLISVFYRKLWTNWWYVIVLYIFLCLVTTVVMLVLIKNSVAISHSLKVGLAIESVLGITFPLIVELFRARIRSDFFLSYLKSCREKFSKRCSSLLLSIVNGDYKKSKYLLQLKDSNVSALKDGETFDNAKLVKTLMSTILQVSEKQALKILTEDNRTFKILCYKKFCNYYNPVDLKALDTEDDLFRLCFTKKKD